MLRKLHTVYCIFITGFATVTLFPLALLMMLVNWSRDGEMWLVSKVWSQILIKSGGATLEVFGRENIDPLRPTIYVSNHQSTLDAPVLFNGLWPVRFRFVSKHTLKYVPVMGWYMWVAKFVFVDRTNHQDAVRSLDAAGAQIRGGISIIVFPEGTRSDDCRVHPFKKGPFALAMKARVPVVPVAIEGSGLLMPKNSWQITPGPITVSIGQPIAPEHFENDRELLIREVRDRIIDQSFAMGGLGGDKTDPIAARGLEGISERGPLPADRSGE